MIIPVLIPRISESDRYSITRFRLLGDPAHGDLDEFAETSNSFSQRIKVHSPGREESESRDRRHSPL